MFSLGGAETPAEQTEDVQVPKPFAIGDVTLAAGKILHVARIDEDHLEAAGLEDLEDRDPVHAGGFHRHVRDPTGTQPGGEPMQIPGKRRERAHGCRVAIGRHGDEVFCGPAIDPGGMRMQTFKRIRRGARLR